MNHRRVWLRCLVGLMLLWAVSGSAMAWLATFEPTPEKLVEQIADRPLEDASPEQRERAVLELAEQMNRLGLDERSDPALLAAVADQFAQMNDDERRLYLEQITPAGIEPAIRRVIEMAPKVRQNFTTSALASADEESMAVVLRAQLGEEQFDALVVQWLSAYLEGGDPQLQFQVQPLIEQMLARMQRSGGSPREARDGE